MQGVSVIILVVSAGMLWYARVSVRDSKERYEAAIGKYNKTLVLLDQAEQMVERAGALHKSCPSVGVGKA